MTTAPGKGDDMCVFPSWIENDRRSWWLTDNLLDEHGIDYQDGVGHSAIRSVYPNANGVDREGAAYKLPPGFARDIRKGRCRRMMAAAGLVSMLVRGGWIRYVEYANGAREWWRDGKRHRDDGPAVEYANGVREWWRDGKWHRDDGPAVECASGYKSWYRDGKRHRDDGPAVEYANGAREWWRDGKRHCDDGPAVEYAYGCKAWWRDGKLHRDDGPAVEYADGTREWWRDGKLLRDDAGEGG